jgi:hypothetical protein
MEWLATIDFIKARARAMVVATAINREGAPCSTFTRASQNVPAVAALLDTLPHPPPIGQIMFPVS